MFDIVDRTPLAAATEERPKLAVIGIEPKQLSLHQQKLVFV